MITENILQFIPQRHPFVMVDILLFANEEKTTTKFTLTKENIFCEDGFFSEAGLLENIAQTVAAGNGYNEQRAGKKVSGGYIAGVKNFKIFFLPKINDVLTTEIVVTGKIFNMTSVTGKILLGDALAARCEMKIFSDSND
jgi:predicted hotdog family 3-hydroxylacyl-ACP dehydratase